MNFRRIALLFLPLVVLAIGARVIRARQPDVWRPNPADLILAANGSRVVALNDDGVPQRLRVWNVAERRAMPVQHPTDKEHIFEKLFSVSPQGEWAVFLARDSKSTSTSDWLEVWDLRRAPVRRAWRVRCPYLEGATWVNGRLVTWENSAIRTYDTRGKLISKVQLEGCTPNQVFNPAAICRDGSVVVDGTNLLLYDARNGKLLRRLEKPRPNADTDIGQFSFSPDAQILVAEDAFTSTIVKLMWNVRTGRLIKPKKPFDGFWTARGHHQIQRNGRVEDVITRQKIATISLPGRGAFVTGIQTSDDGKVVVLQRAGGTVWIQNPRWF